QNAQEMRKGIISALMLALCFLGCEKDVDLFIPNPQDPKPITFRASAFVEVKDFSGAPLQDVTIHLENNTFVTDEDGVAHLENVDMHPATYVTVEKAGYFHGSRRFYPSPDKTHYVKIILLSEQHVGSVSGTSGGVITLSGGVSLSFPSNALKRADGSPYEGMA